MVTVQNLLMRYGNRVLFQDINLKLDRHKRYGLIGANGAGKTTLIQVLLSELSEKNVVVASSSEEVSDNLNKVKNITNETLQASEGIRYAAEELAKLAEVLDQRVGKFTI